MIGRTHSQAWMSQNNSGRLPGFASISLKLAVEQGRESHLEQGEAHIVLEDNAADAPHITGLGPAEF